MKKKKHSGGMILQSYIPNLYQIVDTFRLFWPISTWILPQFCISYCDDICISQPNITSNLQNSYECRKLVGRFFQYWPKNWSTFGHAIEIGTGISSANFLVQPGRNKVNAGGLVQIIGKEGTHWHSGIWEEYILLTVGGPASCKAGIREKPLGSTGLPQIP